MIIPIMPPGPRRIASSCCTISAPPAYTGNACTDSRQFEIIGLGRLGYAGSKRNPPNYTVRYQRSAGPATRVDRLAKPLRRAKRSVYYDSGWEVSSCFQSRSRKTCSMLVRASICRASVHAASLILS